MTMRRLLPLFLLVVLLVLLLPIIAKWFSNQEEQPVSTLPVIEEGGRLSLQVRKKTIVVPLDTVEIGAREVSTNSVLNLYGEGTSMQFNVVANVLHADDEIYRSLIDKKMLIGFPLTKPPNAQIRLGEFGSYALLLGSNLVLKFYERGQGNRVRWKGNAEMFVQTNEGPVTFTGTFSFGATLKTREVPAS